MEMEHATIITNGSSNHENRNQEVGKKMKSLSKADRPYFLYCIVDFLIVLATTCFYFVQPYSGRFDGKADGRWKLSVVFCLALANLVFGSFGILDKNGYYLLTYTVRLFLLATFTAQCSLFASKTDIDVQGPFMTVLYSCLSLFYAFGVPLFLYKTIAISLDMGRAVKKGEWEVVPAHMVALILYNILDLLATICLSCYYLVQSVTEYGVGSVLVLFLILFGLTSATTWTFGLSGLVCKDDIALTIYCIRLLPLLIVPMMGAIACFFLPTNSTVVEIFLLFWVFMVPFYATVLTLFTDKAIALNSDRTRVVMEEVQGEADVMVDVPGLE